MRYLSYRIAKCIAATIAGGKPATLMNISNEYGRLLDVWNCYKAGIFTGSGIDYYELKRTDKNAVVLFFDQNRMNELLKDESVIKFLSECGYESASIDDVLTMLRHRYATGGCPPEIGIFLGIPMKDVKGFMGLNSLQNTKCGMWQIYGEPQVSEKRMDEYRRARKMVIKRLFSGEDPVNIIRGAELGFLDKPSFSREDYLHT